MDKLLRKAVQAGSVEDIVAAVQRGADVNARDEGGETALSYATSTELGPERARECVRFMQSKTGICRWCSCWLGTVRTQLSRVGCSSLPWIGLAIGPERLRPSCDKSSNSWMRKRSAEYGFRLLEECSAGCAPGKTQMCARRRG